MRTALRDSVRAWQRSPVVAGVAVLSLALGIGATTTFFSIVERLLLRTLEVDEPHQLAILSADGPAEAGRFTYPVWEQIRARDQLYEGAFAWWPWTVNLAPHGEVELVQAVFASGGVFRTLRVDTVIGRPFDVRDDVRGGGQNGRAAVISYGLWQRRFGGAADIIGRTLSVERVPFTIVGVAPRSLPGLAVGTSFDVVLPLLSEPAVRPDFSFVDVGRVTFLRIVMRLPPSRSLEAVTASLRADQAAIRDATIAPFRRQGDRDTFLASPFAVVPGAAGSAGAATYYAQSATVALGIGTLLLLACCGNVATVLLAHGARRHFELSVRVALGATRWQAGRQLLVDSLLLSTAGAAAGLALSWWAGPWLVAQWDDTGLTRSMPAALNWRVGAFATATGLVTGVLCGLAAAWRATRIVPADSLKARGPRHSSEAVQRGFVVAQLAFSVVVIVTSSLLLRSYVSIVSVPALARLDGVTAVELRLARSGVPPSARPAVVARVTAVMAAFPGVVSSLAMTAPFYGGAYFWAIEPMDHEGLGEPNRMALVNAVSPSHFDAVGIGVVAGRSFDGRDVASSPRVGVANQTFARKYLGGDQRVPQRVRTGTGKDVRQIEIVGVVEDLPDTSLLLAPEPTMYLARNQDVVEDGVRVRDRTSPGGWRRRRGRCGRRHRPGGPGGVTPSGATRPDRALRVHPRAHAGHRGRVLRGAGHAHRRPRRVRRGQLRRDGPAAGTRYPPRARRPAAPGGYVDPQVGRTPAAPGHRRGLARVVVGDVVRVVVAREHERTSRRRVRRHRRIPGDPRPERCVVAGATCRAPRSRGGATGGVTWPRHLPNPHAISKRL